VSVTGRNFVTGSTDTKTATTEVVTQAVSGLPAFHSPRKDFSPGQFTQRGTGYGWSLGAALGYEVWAIPADYKGSVTITGNGFETWHEPGVVWIQQDENGNGIPDEMWQEVQGSDDKDNHKEHILRRHAITYFKSDNSEGQVNEYDQIIRAICWVDARGKMGVIPGGWPTVGNEKGITGVAGNWITYTGTLLRDGGNTINDGTDRKGMSGYVDVYANNSQSLTVPNARFVKVQTAYFAYGTSVGDISTEIVSATGLPDQSGGFTNPIDVR
jgi:hypothetical protein